MSLVVSVLSRKTLDDSKTVKPVGVVTIKIVLGGVDVAVFASTPYVRDIPDTVKCAESFLEGLRAGLMNEGIQTTVKRGDW